MYFKDYPDIDFIEETQPEFDARIIEVKKRWVELDKQLPVQERFIRLLRANNLKREIREDLEEVPQLFAYLDKKYGELPQETKDRLNKYYLGGKNAK